MCTPLGTSPVKAPGKSILAFEDKLNEWDVNSQMEWIVTNGIGGYASGTLVGANTRRYHGFLMAAMAPPLGRTLFVARIEETIIFKGRAYPLAGSQWWDGSVSPELDCLAEFRLEDGLPVFSFDIAGHRLEKRIWMEWGENSTWAAYHWPADAPPATISIRLYMAHRDFHGTQHGSSDWHWRSGGLPDGFWASPGEGASRTIFTFTSPFRLNPENQWYWGFLRCIERERGLDDTEDLWVPASVEMALQPAAMTGFRANIEGAAVTGKDCTAALAREQDRRSRLLDTVQTPLPTDECRALAIGADMFLVRRPVGSELLPDRPNTIVAGYHWFGDWGRDTMIALPGLALTTGRFLEARRLLLSYSAFASEGMIPNRFPDSGGSPDYNTVDATLLYFIAIHHYDRATGDSDLVSRLMPCLSEMIDAHILGTRHGIGMDETDGLLRAGGPGLQLTWMDAKVGDWVVTPRTGKPVEISALWYNALRLLGKWSERLGMDGTRYEALAARAKESFLRRYPIANAAYLYDVIDGPEGDDPSFRPNQLFAASLPFPLLSPEAAGAMVDECDQRLLTPCGLRSLDPANPRYVGHYGGDQWRRDGSYHQGTVWAWLIGPYVDALLYAYGDRKRAKAALLPLVHQVRAAGIGSISEIFDGDYPHTPRGCIAQAWSVGEVLRLIRTLGPLSDVS